MKRIAFNMLLFMMAVFMLSATIVTITSNNKTSDIIAEYNSSVATSSSGSQPQQNMPTGDSTDATLNLLLLNNPTVDAYIKEWFKLTEQAIKGEFKPVKSEVKPTVKSILGILLVEQKTYPNTYLPKSYMPYDSNAGRLYYNEAYKSYSAKDMTLASFNHNMISTPGFSYGKGDIPVSRDLLNSDTHGPFQQNLIEFGVSGQARYPTINTAVNPSLTPYKESNNSSRLSDISYLPDELVNLLGIYDSVYSNYISKMDLSKYTPKQQSDIADMFFAMEHNTGGGALKSSLYYGYGNEWYSKFKPSSTTGPDMLESYGMFGADISRALTEAPSSLPAYGGDINAYLLYGMIMPVLSKENNWDHRWYLDPKYANYIAKYAVGNSQYSNNLLANFRLLTKNKSATKTDVQTYILGLSKAPTQVTDSQTFKAHGVTDVRNMNFVWREMQGSNIFGNESVPRIQMLGYISLRYVFASLAYPNYYYPHMLVAMGVAGVDPTDPATYINQYKQNNSTIIPTTEIGGVFNGGLIAPPSGVVDATMEWVIHYFNKGAPANSKVGIAHESGYKDGIPIYVQYSQFTFNRADNPDLYLIKYRNSSGEVVPTPKQTYLGRNGCGIFTMTSIINGVGKGSLQTASTHTKEAINFQNSILSKSGRKTSDRLQPWALALFNGTYYNTSKGFPLWMVIGSASSGPQAKHEFAPILTYMGVPTKAMGQSYTKKQLETQMESGCPVLVAQNGSYKWHPYVLIDKSSGIVKPTKLVGNDSLSKGGHILAFYDCVTLKDVNGKTDKYIKIIDSGTYSVSYDNALFFKLDNLNSNKPPAWFIQLPIVGLGKTSNTPAPSDASNQDDPTKIGLDNDILDAQYTVSTSNNCMAIFNITKVVSITDVKGDKYTYDGKNFTLFRGSVSYTFANMKNLKIKQSSKPIDYLSKDVISIDPKTFGTKVVVIANDINSKYETLHPHDFTSENTDID